ncbi:peritrophin-44 [Drosophila novamexicana]|uniref:peritrophin-44 n=1 Tax=Drosophila novamexicana TaxID=47314 RepID=UPI0011E5965E|nr:peritrophin-44 [Drosophila novamexicana]
MRVSSRWLHAIVFVVPLWQTCGLAMNQICSYWPGSGYIGDPSDCHSWGYCKNNKLSAKGECPNGLFYDAQSGTCQQAHLVRCAPQYWELCAQRRRGEYVSDPLDCRKYKQCDEEGGKIEENYCAGGYVFSNRLQTCVSSANGCAEETLSICGYVQNGTTLGDPLNCGLYLECQSGTGIRRACTAARYYNHNTGRCQTTRPNHCPSDENSYKPANYPPPAMDASVCTDFYQDNHSGIQLITDAQTCHGYYTCGSKYVLGIWHSCPHGTHFQWWSQKCVTPESYSCPYDRCGNLNSSLVAGINSGCSEYIYCQDQTSQQIGKCPEELPYFDEKRGACIRDFPNYTVCFMDG